MFRLLKMTELQVLTKNVETDAHFLERVLGGFAVAVNKQEARLKA